MNIMQLLCHPGHQISFLREPLLHPHLLPISVILQEVHCILEESYE